MRHGAISAVQSSVLKHGTVSWGLTLPYLRSQHCRLIVAKVPICYLCSTDLELAAYPALTGVPRHQDGLWRVQWTLADRGMVVPTPYAAVIKHPQLSKRDTVALHTE